MDRTVRGSTLSPACQKAALAAFQNRYTRTHHPAWTRSIPGYVYPLQFDSDEDWLAHTDFAVTASGKLDRRVRYCTSSPSWPDNPELRPPGWPPERRRLSASANIIHTHNP